MCIRDRAVASPYIRETSRRIKEFVRKDQIVVDVAKGIEEETLMTMTDIIEEEIPGVQTAVLSGPSHAEEVGKGLPTTCVVAARKKEVAQLVQSVFMSPVFRVYTSPDMLGVELGGALKNEMCIRDSRWSVLTRRILRMWCVWGKRTVERV